ncbi:MAG: MaoC/PaaZ C-terminal domain-containing protein [Thermoplasmata archaeon]
MSYKFRGRYFDDFNVGDVIETASRTVTEADVAFFAGLSGDYNPLHTDEEFMKGTPFGGRIAHGMLIASIATGQANQLGVFEGTSLALLSMTLKFMGAVKFGDTVRTVLTCREKKESSKPDRGTATFDVRVLNQRGEVVVESEWIVLLRKRQAVERMGASVGTG